MCHTLNPRLSIAHVAAIVNEAQDRWIAVGAGLQPMLQEIIARCPCVEGVLILDGERLEPSVATRLQRWELAEFIRRQGRAAPWGHFDENAAAGLCYTSGTVGDPRGVLYSHRSNYLHTLRSLQADAVALTAADTVLIAVPLFMPMAGACPLRSPPSAAGTAGALGGGCAPEEADRGRRR